MNFDTGRDHSEDADFNVGMANNGLNARPFGDDLIFSMKDTASISWLPALLLAKDTRTRITESVCAADVGLPEVDGPGTVLLDGGLVRFETGADGQARPQSLTYPDGLKCEYRYSAAGKLLSVKVNDATGSTIMSVTPASGDNFSIRVAGIQDPLIGRIVLDPQTGQLNASVTGKGYSNIELRDNMLLLDYTRLDQDNKTRQCKRCVFDDGSYAILQKNESGVYVPQLSKYASGTMILYKYVMDEMVSVEKHAPKGKETRYERQENNWVAFSIENGDRGRSVSIPGRELKLDAKFVPPNPEIDKIADKTFDTLPKTENARALERILTAQQLAFSHIDLLYNKEVETLINAGTLEALRNIQIKKGAGDLTNDEYKTISEQAKSELEPALAAIAEKRAADRKQLQAEFDMVKKAAVSENPEKALEVWHKCVKTQEAYKKTLAYLETESLPAILNRARARGAAPPLDAIVLKLEKGIGTPESPLAFSARCIDKVPLVEDKDRLPTSQDIEHIKNTGKWVAALTEQEKLSSVRFDLNHVFPQLIKAGGYPPAWAGQLESGNPEDAHAAIAVTMYNCARIRGYVKELEQINKGAGVELPPGCKWDKAGDKEIIVVDYPVSIDPKDNKEQFAVWDAWIAKNGPRIDELAAQRRSGDKVFYGEDKRYGEFGAVLDAKGNWTGERVPCPKREHFAAGSDGDSMYNAARAKWDAMPRGNFVRGDLEVTVANGRYFVTQTQEVRFSGRRDYMNIGANTVAKKVEVLGPKGPKGEPLGYERGTKVNVSGWRNADDWQSVEDLEEWKLWRQLTFHGGEVVTGATDAALVISAAYTGGTSAAILWGGGRISARVLVPALIRGSLGASGIVLNNANAEANHDLEFAMQARGWLMFADLTRGVVFRGGKSASLIGFEQELDLALKNSQTAAVFYKSLVQPLKVASESRVNHAVQLGGTGYLGFQSGCGIYDQLTREKSRTGSVPDGPFAPKDSLEIPADQMRKDQIKESELTLLRTHGAILSAGKSPETQSIKYITQNAALLKDANDKESASAFKSSMVKLLTDSKTHPAVRLAAADALLVLGTDNAGNLPADGILFSDADITFRRSDLSPILAAQSKSGDTACRIVASELRTRLGEQSAFDNVVTLKKVLHDSNATSEQQAFATVQLGSYLHTIRYMEQWVVPGMNSVELRNYRAESYEYSSKEVEQQLKDFANFKNQKPELKLLAELVLFEVNRSDNEDVLCNRLSARADEWANRGHEGYADRSIAELQAMVSQGDAKTKLDAIAALRRLNELLPQQSQSNYNKDLIGLINQDLSRKTFSPETVRAIEMLDTPNGLTADERMVLCNVLTDPAHATNTSAKVAICKRLKEFARTDDDKNAFALAINVLVGSPANTLIYPADYPELREAAVYAIADLDGRNTDVLRRLMTPPQEGAGNGIDCEPSAAVRLAAIKTANKLQPTWLPAACKNSLHYERDYVCRANIIDLTITKARPIYNDEYFITRSERSGRIVKMTGLDNLPADWSLFEPTVKAFLPAIPPLKLERAIPYSENVNEKFVESAPSKKVKTLDADRPPGIAFKVSYPNPDFDNYLFDQLGNIALQCTDQGKEARNALKYIAFSRKDLIGADGKALDSEARDKMRVLALRCFERGAAPDSKVRTETRALLEMAVYDKNVNTAAACECLKILDRTCLNTPEERREMGLSCASAFKYLTLMNGNAPGVTNPDLAGRALVCQNLADMIMKYPTIEGFGEIDAYANIDDKDVINEFKEVHRRTEIIRAEMSPAVLRLWNQCVPVRQDRQAQVALLQEALLPSEPGLSKALGRALTLRPLVTSANQSTQKLYAACKGEPLAAKDDERVSFVRMCMRGREQASTPRNASVAPERKGTNAFEHADRDGSQQLRLGSALVVLQPENTGFSAEDRIAALKVCADSIADEVEHGFRHDSSKLFDQSLKQHPDEAVIAAAELVLENHPASAELSRRLVSTLGENGRLERSRGDGSRLVVRTVGGKMLIEKYAPDQSGGPETLAKVIKDPRLNYPDVAFLSALSEKDPEKKLLSLKRIIESPEIDAKLHSKLRALEVIKAMALNEEVAPKLRKSCTAYVLSVGPTGSGGFETRGADNGQLVNRLYKDKLVTEKYDSNGRLLEAKVDNPGTSMTYADTIIAPFSGKTAPPTKQEQYEIAKAVLESLTVSTPPPSEDQEQVHRRLLWSLARDGSFEQRNDALLALSCYQSISKQFKYDTAQLATTRFLAGDDTLVDVMQKLPAGDRVKACSYLAGSVTQLNLPSKRRNGAGEFLTKLAEDDVKFDMALIELAKVDPKRAKELSELRSYAKAQAVKEQEEQKESADQMEKKRAQAERCLKAFIALQKNLPADVAASQQNDAAVVEILRECKDIFGDDYPLKGLRRPPR